MEGYLTLVNINIPNSGLYSSPTKKYTNVKATFCAISWKNQETDPSRVPMFKDLKQQSSLCPGTTYSVDLWDISRKAHDYDARNHTFAATEPREGQGPVAPTAVVFHETRCGSTLISNTMASFMPKHTRVYSESPPPVDALRACDDDRSHEGGKRHCDPGAQDALIQDVFYMMGRITRIERPQFVFYKIQSIGSHSIDAFVRAMPDTPWLFAYRDSVEIMMSHFKNYQMGNPLSSSFFPVCLRSFGKPNPNPVLKSLVEAQGSTVDQLTKEEFCAAHLASLAESAVREHDKVVGSGSKTPHWFVNYSELPNRIWGTILPAVTRGLVEIDQTAIAKMQQIGHTYSKGRGQKAGQRWHEDSTLKQGNAPAVVKDAVAKFLDPVYKRMESIRLDEL